MGWFDAQIRQRKLNDQEVFEDSMIRMASTVLGRQSAGMLNDSRIVTKAAIDDILKYYHRKPAVIPDRVKDRDEQLDYALRPYGIMYRDIHLEKGWYKDAFGPVLAFEKKSGQPCALLPAFYGYRYTDPASGKQMRLNSSTEDLFEQEAVCFYRPLPQRKIGIRDLLIYMGECLEFDDILQLVLMTLAATVIGMILPSVTKIMTGYVAESDNVNLLAGTSIFMVCAGISSQIMSACRALMMSRVQTKISVSVEASVMMRIMNLPASFFRMFSSGELASRFSAVKQLCTLLIGTVLSASLTSVTSLLYVGQIFRFARSLVVPALLILAATLVLSTVTTLMQTKISREIMEISAKNSGLSFSLISGVQKIKQAGAEKRAFAKWAEAYAETSRRSFNPPVFLKANGAINTAVSLCGTLVLYYLAVTNNVSPSEYIAFNAAYGAVSGAFSILSSAALSVAQIRPILEMAEPILEAEPETSENKIMVTSLNGNIELSNVCFRYKESQPYVVDGMNLKIKAGEYVAICGKTGCGKSTLMRLLLGFEKPERGAVFYDGKNINRLDLHSLRSKIGTVTQDGALFQGDIYSNIVISAPQLSLQEAWEAAETAGIADDIRQMPMGMNTIIAEGQGGISGGQKQRLMIARAIAPKPRILMFDEATSALDNRTQKKVSDALDELKCTRIVIAHRLSTIRHCDRILFLQDGKIAEDGTYDELIAKNGLFAEMVERQRLDD